MHVVEYKGETLNTIFYEEISNDKLYELKEAYYKKPDFTLIERELKGLKMGKTKISNIEKYYMRELMSKVLLSHSKWAIEDIFDHKPLCEFFYGRMKAYPKVCPPDKSDIVNLETMIRLGGKGVACKPTNFPIKAVDEILKQYNINGNYYDFSCGWGVRLLSSLRNNVNYFGTDPNYLLTERLEVLANDYKKTNGECPSVDIRNTGSEVFHQDWVNTMGVAFSSPPYFNLEDYKIGEQSYKQGMEYGDWLNGYFSNTLDNIMQYLIPNGVLAINVNKVGKYNLAEDIKELAISKGFVYETFHSLKNIQRINCKNEMNDNSERIMIFRKP